MAGILNTGWNAGSILGGGYSPSSGGLLTAAPQIDNRNKWADAIGILGATLQDVDASVNGVGRGGNLDRMQQRNETERLRRLKEQVVQQIQAAYAKGDMAGVRAAALQDPELGASIVNLLKQDAPTFKEVGGGLYELPTTAGGTPRQVIAPKVELPKAPTSRTRREGMLDVFEEWDPANGRWNVLSRGAAFKPESAGDGPSNVQSVQPLADGTLLIVRRDGTATRASLDGKPVTGAQFDPQTRYSLNAASAGGKAAGAIAESLPAAEASFTEINKALDAFETPEVKAQAGRSLGLIDSRLPTIPGYNSNFNNRVAQLQGQTFLQAFNNLRGGGQITEVEGEKATNALTRLNRASSEKEFYEALRDARATFATIQGAVRQRAQRGAVVPQLRAGGNAPQPANGGFSIRKLP